MSPQNKQSGSRDSKNAGIELLADYPKHGVKLMRCGRKFYYEFEDGNIVEANQSRTKTKTS